MVGYVLHNLPSVPPLPLTHCLYLIKVVLLHTELGHDKYLEEAVYFKNVLYRFYTLYVPSDSGSPVMGSQSLDENRIIGVTTHINDEHNTLGDSNIT